MDTDCAVLIVGGGPCGLMLANELGPRGIRAILVDEKPGTALNPQANATQARTMEHYRRLGFADEIRALGLPQDYPTDIAYFTRFASYELARFGLPPARKAKALVTSLSGSWSAAELPHRVSQKFVEAILRRHAESYPSISIKYGWRLLGFIDRETHVEAQLEGVSSGERGAIRARYLVGADGARGLVRRQLGFQYIGDAPWSSRSTCWSTAPGSVSRAWCWCPHSIAPRRCSWRTTFRVCWAATCVASSPWP